VAGFLGISMEDQPLGSIQFTKLNWLYSQQPQESYFGAFILHNYIFLILVKFMVHLQFLSKKS